MDTGHSHSHTTAQRLGLAIVLNTLTFAVELIGGILTNSLALISDAMHNLSDALALVLSYIATRIVLWKSNSRKSYGYVRIEIFIAFINALTLVFIGSYIIYKGISRFLSPEHVAGTGMVLVAVVGLLANVGSTLLLRKEAHRDLNIQSAYLHLLTDAVESLAVVVVGFFIFWKGWYVLDPIISTAIGMFVIHSAWTILVETVNILTEGTPKGIDLDDVATFIRSFPGVDNVHHIHIWGLSSQFRALSAHLVVKDRLISEGCVITDEIERGLRDHYRINHPTLKLESEICERQDTIVDINHTDQGTRLHGSSAPKT
ncbi:MAG TPA: cation diffusion facilitator family transporter [Bacteroidota bacterium]|nr:cation diffusion facilitator family transporter [Bacteroidota bacterium]